MSVTLQTSYTWNGKMFVPTVHLRTAWYYPSCEAHQNKAVLYATVGMERWQWGCMRQTGKNFLFSHLHLLHGSRRDSIPEHIACTRITSCLQYAFVLSIVYWRTLNAPPLMDLDQWSLYQPLPHVWLCSLLLAECRNVFQHKDTWDTVKCVPLLEC